MSRHTKIPAQNETDSKCVRMEIRMTRSESEHIDTQAEELGISRSEYVRHAALERAYRVHSVTELAVELHDAVVQLKRIEKTFSLYVQYVSEAHRVFPELLPQVRLFHPELCQIAEALVAISKKNLHDFD